MNIHYNFSDSSVFWFSSYLSSRKQYVQLDSVKSPESEIFCGVPQGSILGPTLFIMYINDLMLNTQFFEPILFADDTNLFIKSRNLNELVIDINYNLESVLQWCNRNRLTLNVDKTNINLWPNFATFVKLQWLWPKIVAFVTNCNGCEKCGVCDLNKGCKYQKSLIK